jgi:hypothetical protein
LSCSLRHPTPVRAAGLSRNWIAAATVPVIAALNAKIVTMQGQMAAHFGGPGC